MLLLKYFRNDVAAGVALLLTLMLFGFKRRFPSLLAYVLHPDFRPYFPGNHSYIFENFSYQALINITRNIHFYLNFTNQTSCMTTQIYSKNFSYCIPTQHYPNATADFIRGFLDHVEL
jgi:hypothetical protein